MKNAPTTTPQTGANTACMPPRGKMANPQISIFTLQMPQMPNITPLARASATLSGLANRRKQPERYVPFVLMREKYGSKIILE